MARNLAGPLQTADNMRLFGIARWRLAPYRAYGKWAAWRYCGICRPWKAL